MPLTVRSAAMFPRQLGNAGTGNDFLILLEQAEEGGNRGIS